MLKIRLLRTGKKHDPSYRVVAVDSREAPQSGKFIENLGNYNPKKGDSKFKSERIKFWLSQGAQISDTIHNLLINEKIIEGEKRDVLHHDRIKKRKIQKTSATGTSEDTKTDIDKK